MAFSASEALTSLGPPFFFFFFRDSNQKRVSSAKTRFVVVFSCVFVYEYAEGGLFRCPWRRAYELELGGLIIFIFIGGMGGGGTVVQRSTGQGNFDCGMYKCIYIFWVGVYICDYIYIKKKKKVYITG